VTVKSSAHATRGYYDALAQAEQRARSAEQRLATLEQLVADGALAAVPPRSGSRRRRFLRVVAQTNSLPR
jgi:hypothetical protein